MLAIHYIGKKGRRVPFNTSFFINKRVCSHWKRTRRPKHGEGEMMWPWALVYKKQNLKEKHCRKIQICNMDSTEMSHIFSVILDAISSSVWVTIAFNFVRFLSLHINFSPHTREIRTRDRVESNISCHCCVIQSVMFNAVCVCICLKNLKKKWCNM